MHERILTQREKEEIEEYLKSGHGSAFIYTLRYRARKFLPRLKEEIAILENFMEEPTC